MARYYCDYCHSYLTHDTLSVRKSHLIGKNHLRITADYYRNQNVQNQNQRVKHCRRKHNTRGKHAPVKIHCLTKKEKRLQRKTIVSHSKQLQNNYLSLQDDLSKIYYGSPGYSKIWIDQNRFDINDLIKLAGVPKRANVTANSNNSNSSLVPPQQQNRDHLYSQQDIIAKPVQLQLPPPMILQQWSNTVPKYTTYNDKGKQLHDTINIISHKRTRPDDSASGSYNSNKRYHPSSVATATNTQHRA